MKEHMIKPNITIDEIGKAFSRYIDENWEEVLNNHKEKFEALFPEYEDATYGMYLDHLLPPFWKEVEMAGFRSAEKTKEDDFIIAGCLNFRNSIEKTKWKPYEHRVFWIVIENDGHQEIGTLIFELSHSHSKFKVPEAPVVSIFKVTDRKEITEKIIERKENQ
ncbi:DUF6022 family protein [Pseudalkalibacillus salsuginis]|uniref:DUF6022 family protein n=1 Tax=Pseudalkalibacillus salsuginis TaxID=2910972 RepID=UPI001F34AA3D|nr:DUF6022 family protein [Pseudalkalibacillus salsuginis]MCF6409424.1 DUF6022 family protein [Pseudalkalibacillus salsuginis]